MPMRLPARLGGDGSAGPRPAARSTRGGGRAAGRLRPGGRCAAWWTASWGAAPVSGRVGGARRVAPGGGGVGGGKARAGAEQLLAQRAGLVLDLVQAAPLQFGHHMLDEVRE